MNITLLLEILFMENSQNVVSNLCDILQPACTHFICVYMFYLKSKIQIKNHVAFMSVMKWKPGFDSLLLMEEEEEEEIGNRFCEL